MSTLHPSLHMSYIYMMNIRWAYYLQPLTERCLNSLWSLPVYTASLMNPSVISFICEIWGMSFLVRGVSGGLLLQLKSLYWANAMNGAVLGTELLYIAIVDDDGKYSFRKTHSSPHFPAPLSSVHKLFNNSAAFIEEGASKCIYAPLNSLGSHSMQGIWYSPWAVSIHSNRELLFWASGRPIGDRCTTHYINFH